MEIATKVSETITFLVGQEKPTRENFLKLFRESIDNSPLSEDFRDANIILVENDMGGRRLQECFGIELALDILRKDPLAKVVLYGFLPMKALLKLKPAISLVLKYENAFWVEAPLTPENFMGIFRTKKDFQSSGYGISDEVRRHIGTILHRLNYVKDWDNPGEHEKVSFENGISEVRKYFPAMATASVAEIVEFLRTVSDAREEVMKGVTLEGVYCDVEGTIYSGDSINQTIVSKLREYEQQGKQITLWSDGNIEELRTRLTQSGLLYPLKSKFDHAGAIAEIVIDDLDEYTFTARTKISALTFIRVSDVR